MGCVGDMATWVLDIRKQRSTSEAIYRPTDGHDIVRASLFARGCSLNSLPLSISVSNSGWLERFAGSSAGLMSEWLIRSLTHSGISEVLDGQDANTLDNYRAIITEH